MAVSYVDRQTLAVLAPRVTTALDIGEQGYALLASAFSIAYLVGAPLAGRLIDHVGARRGLLGAVLVWSAIAALHALVPGFALLFVLRILLGLAESPSFPGAAQTVHRALPPDARARGFGLLFTGSSIGAAVAAPLATWIEAHHGWRVAFLVTAAIGLAWVPMWLALAYRPDARAVLDRATEGPRARSPVGAIVRHPAVLRASAAMLASAPIFAFVLLWGAKYLVRDHGLVQADVGRYLWLPTLAFDGGAILFGHLASVRGDRGTAPRALFAAAALLATTIALGPLATGPWQAIAACALALVGGGGLYALLTSDMLARIPPGDVSTASGITAAVQSIAFIAANPLIAWSVERSGHYATAMLGLGAWVLPGALYWLTSDPAARRA